MSITKVGIIDVIGVYNTRIGVFGKPFSAIRSMPEAGCCITVSLYHCIAVSLFRFITVSLYHDSHDFSLSAGTSERDEKLQFKEG